MLEHVEAGLYRNFLAALVYTGVRAGSAMDGPEDTRSRSTASSTGSLRGGVADG